MICEEDMRFTLLRQTKDHNHIQNRKRHYQIDVYGDARAKDVESNVWERSIVNAIHKIITKTMNI